MENSNVLSYISDQSAVGDGNENVPNHNSIYFFCLWVDDEGYKNVYIWDLYAPSLSKPQPPVA